MQNINVFQKGIVADLDNSKRDNQVWDFPTLNARLLNYEGQGYIITNIEGNDFQNVSLLETIGIELPLGFVPIGACELNGIAYILSWNNATQEGEIGTYPSPATIVSVDYVAPSVTLGIGLTGFNRVYRPLVNFNTSATRHPFRTSMFQLDINKLADIFAVPSYDDTVDIFIADGINLNRVINSGFNSNGELTDNRIYDNNSFPFFVSQIPLTSSLPRTSIVRVEEGGEMMSGNYFIYFKYVTESFNKTHIVHEIGPISIFAGDSNDIYSVEGIRGTAGTSGREDRSSKRLSIDLDNIDTQYKYVQVVLTRSWSDSTGIIIDDIYTVDKYYEIDDQTITIKINGNETLISGTLNDVLNKAPKELTCETHTTIDNRYYGANWKKFVVHDDRLTQYAKKIVPGFAYGGTNAQCRILKSVGYKNSEYIRTKLGYFRNECYPVGVVFVYKGGIESDVYPIAGVDDKNNDGYLINDGLYRFPGHDLCKTSYLSHLYLLAFLFQNSIDLNNDNESAINYYLNNKTWFDENIIGFYYVRGERYKNMLYQGLLMYGCRSYRSKTTGNYCGDYPGIVEQFNESATIFNSNSTGDTPQGLVPHGCSNIRYDSSSGNTGYYNELDIAPIVADRKGLIKDIKGDVGGEWAVWLGQDHQQGTNNTAVGGYWGSSALKSELFIDDGGREDTVTSKGDANKGFYNDQWKEGDVEKGLVMPIWKGFFPCAVIHNKNDVSKNLIKNYHRRAYYVEKKYAMISSDYLLNAYADVNKTGVLVKLYDTSYNENLDGIDPGDKDTYPWWWKANLVYNQKNVGTAITGVKFTDVPKFTRIASAKDGFVSEYTDPGFEDNISYGFSQLSSCMWYWYKDNEEGEGGGNRSMSTCKYIGITTDNAESDLNLSISAIYVNDPMGAVFSGNNLHNFFDLKNVLYKKISRLYALDEVTDASPQFGGDCFLQQSFYKQMSWRGNSWNYYDRDNEEAWSGYDKDNREANNKQKTINSGHGLVIGMITENAINADLRHSFDNRTFYPKCGEDGLKTFAVANPDTNDKTESLLINNGYNQLMPLNLYVNYNVNLPFVNTKNETRIRYSDKYIVGSFINSLRELRQNNYVDYDLSAGKILRVFNHLNSLVSYQADAINLHYTGERQAKVNTDSETLFLGTGDILAQEVRVLANTGIQNKWAVIKGDRGILSLDWNKRTINYVSLGQVGTTLSLIAYDYTKSKLISSYIVSLCESFEKLTDIKNPLPDTLYQGVGVSTGYNRKYGEIYLSIRYFGENKTLIFNENLDSFIGEAGFVSPFYITLNNDFYSVFWTGITANTNRLFRHDVTNKPQNFYNTIGTFKLSMIVNGLSEEQNTVMFSKRFASVEIEASEVGFSEIEYTTLKQIGLHDVFDVNDSRFWLSPEYSEGKWKLPIQAQTSGSSFPSANEFDIDSDMRGEWMKIEIRYVGTQKIFIKNVITNYEISNF